MAHVSDEKKRIVAEFVKLLLEYPNIGVLDMENLPAKQLQTMRHTLRDKILMKMTKRRLMKLAFDEAEKKKPGISKMMGFTKGMPALLFSCENPFKLYKFLQKNKSPAPAKAGQTAPKDIIIPAGPTPFAPGPVIGELGQFRIKTGVEANKVVIKQDSTVAKEGEKITPKLAELLTRLNILPMEVGLDLVAVYEDGEIITKDVLAVDEDKYIADLGQAGLWALNLAIESGYASKDTIELLLSKAHGDAKAIGREANILADELVGELMGKADSSAKALAAELNIETTEAPPEEKAAEPEKPEEKEPEPAETPKEEPAEEAPKEAEESEEPAPEEVAEEEPEEQKEPEAPAEEPKKEEDKQPVEDPAQPDPEPPVEEHKEEAKPEEPPKKEKVEEHPKEEEKVEEAEPPAEEPAEEKPEEPPEEEKAEEEPEAAEEPELEEPAEEKVAEDEKAEAEKVEEIPEKKIDAQTESKINSNVDKLLAKTKAFADGKIPKADDLLKEG